MSVMISDITSKLKIHADAVAEAEAPTHPAPPLVNPPPAVN